MTLVRRLILVTLVALVLLGLFAALAAAAPYPGSAQDQTKAAIAAQQIGHSLHLATARASTTYVYITGTGACYHRHYCVSHHAHYRVTLKYARAHYRPCKVCHPPR
jgi:hypothetical protein